MTIPGVEFMDAQPLVFARPQTVTVTRRELNKVFDAYVAAYAAQTKQTYNQAFDKIRTEQPELFQAWLNNK